MLGERFRRGNPRHLRQRAVLHVALEDVEVAVAGCCVGAGARLVVQRAAGLCILVLLEVQQRVVAVVADVGVARPAPGARGVQARADVLVDLPRDAGGLQHLRIRRPAVAGFSVVDHGATADVVVADVAGPHVVAVRIGRRGCRAVIGVADGESVGQRVVERNVLARQVRHRRGALVRDPAIVTAAVDGKVRVVPAVRQVLQELQAQIGRARAERQHFTHATGHRLMPDALAARQRDGARIAIPAHATQRAEVMVERAVFLHEDHDVLHVFDRAVRVMGGNRQRLANAFGHRAHGCGGSSQLGSGTEKTTATVGGHVLVLMSVCLGLGVGGAGDNTGQRRTERVRTQSVDGVDHGRHMRIGRIATAQRERRHHGQSTASAGVLAGRHR
ncbi:hypothetical protein COLO4_01693 [Corchorus olitorius]|uniref:Uncharacterized protein n=1 Tax=Corchorus olitorius TaxID=93759 RepID=A0A1R3L2B4_9ROSI|nr:hypothetical protein COLO4_01693 [Corchorus olitorius]